MNSHQRRSEKRSHPHCITLHIESVNRYDSHDAKVSNATKWCKKKCKGAWRVQHAWDHSEFKFANHKDATVFALKWI